VDGSGVQIYECEKNSNGTGLVYTSVGAMTTLSSPDGISFNGKYTSVGYHYFLSEPLAQGGKPTFSFSMKAGEPISAIPESTVTCNPIFSFIFSFSSMNILQRQKSKYLFIILQLVLMSNPGNVLAQKMLDSEDVDDLLLKAVSHSARGHASWVSYVQRMHSRGGVPPSSCEEVGKQVNIPYTAQYLFWQQDRSLPMGIPVEISVSENFSPLVSFYSEGIQYYRFNGSSWINFNVSAYLYTSPGQEVVGWHYFSTKPDQNGGQPTWELFMPFSRVTVKVVSSITVDSDSIDWTELEATSHGGNKYVIPPNCFHILIISFPYSTDVMTPYYFCFSLQKWTTSKREIHAASFYGRRTSSSNNGGICRGRRRIHVPLFNNLLVLCIITLCIQ
jgi:hypothetical protein